mmetsp:Transcript_9856/g.18575  ORF Transcript_9856/g.18575 Transcript_9856/m.18575 type:complete len:260 (-) Transcript_9856:556-1335(-)
MHVVAVVALDVRVDNVHHLAALGGDVVLHARRCGEEVLVPCEVALAVGVLDVQPDDVVGHDVLVKAVVHLVHIRLVTVVPAALVVPDGEERRQVGVARQRRVLLHHVCGRRPWHKEDVQQTRFGEPRSLWILGGGVAAHVHIHLRSVQPKHARGALDAVRHEEGDGSVQTKGAVVQILKHVQVVESVRLGGDSLTLSRFESHCSSMLRQTVHLLTLRKGDVEHDRCGTEADLISKALELGLPHILRVVLLACALQLIMQ